MDLKEFSDTLSEAAAAHNIALINRRSENNEKSLQYYSLALQLYTKCLDAYKQKGGSSDSSRDSSLKTEDAAVNLELKISQTLQSMAKLYWKALRDASSAIKAHEDVISLLLIDSKEENLDTSHQRDHKSNGEMMVKSRHTSPTSVTDNHHSITNGFNIVTLTAHERTRIISLSLNALGQIYFQQECNEPNYNLEQRENALQYYEESLKILNSLPNPVSTTTISALGQNQKETHSVLNANLSLAAHQNDYKIDLRSDVVNTLIDIGMVYKYRGDFMNVVKIYEQARDLRLLSNCSVSDQEMIESLLALAYEKIGKFDLAFSSFQHALRLRKSLFGEKSIQVANLCYTIGNVHQTTGDFYQALSWNKRAIDVYSMYIDHENSALQYNCRRHLISSLQNQGVLYIQLLEIKEAIVTYLAVIKAQVQFIGEEHPDVAKTLNALGVLYAEQKAYEEAKSSFKRALAMYRKYGVGENDPDLLKTRESLSEIEFILQDENNIAKGATISRNPQSIELPQNNIPDSTSDYNERFVTVVETNASFDDDAVSQITFLTHKETIPTTSKAKRRKKKYEVVDTWSPAEYVYQAVTSLATVAEDFFSGPEIRSSKQAQKVTSKRRNKIDKTLSSLLEVSLSSWSGEKSSPSKSIRDTEFRQTKNSSSPNSKTKKCFNSTYDDDDTSTLLGTTLISSVIGYDDDVTVTKYSTNKQGQKNFTYDNDDESTLFGARYVNSRGDGEGTSTEQVDQHSKTQLTGNDALSTANNVSLAEMMSAISINESISLSSAQRGCIDAFLVKMSDLNCTTGRNKLFQEKEKSNISADDYFDQLSKCLDALIDLRDQYGETHPEVIKKTLELAALHMASDNFEKAIKTFKDVESLQRNKFGTNSVQVAETLKKVGKAYAKHGDIAEAIHSFNEAKSIESFLFGPNHPRVAEILNQMGIALLDNDNVDSAMKYFQQGLDMQKNSVSLNEMYSVHETFVNIGKCFIKEQNNLHKSQRQDSKCMSFVNLGILQKIAFAHGERGEYVTAIHFYELVIDLLKAKKDSSTLIMAETHNLLGVMNRNAGRYSAAIEEHSKALKIFEEANDCDSLDICNTKCQIAVVDYHMGNYSQAARVLETCLTEQRTIVGNDHAQVAKSLFHLGTIKRIECDFDRAVFLLNQCLKIQKSTLHQNHPDIIASERELGVIFLELNRLGDARAQFDRAYSNQINLYGESANHPDLVKTIHYIGVYHSIQSNPKKAMKYFEHAYRMYKSVANCKSPFLSNILDELASLFILLGKFEKASTVLEDGLQIRRSIGEKHFECCFSFLRMGTLMVAQQNYPGAISILGKAMSMAVSQFGLEHPFVADIHLEVGLVHMRRCQFQEGKKEIEDAMKIYRKFNLNDSHYKMRKANEAFKRISHEEEICV
jgi:tetratricopeptide (TPR) repeat protein